MCFIIVKSFTVSAQHINIYTSPNICANDPYGYIMAAVVTEDYAPPFHFEWTDQSGNILKIEETEGESFMEDILPGIYCVTITSADGCTAESCDLVVETEMVIENLTPICICEYGGAEYEVTGGSGDYTYFWELTGEQFVITHNEPYPKFIGYESITELPDTYILTVTDGNGCQATASMTIDTCSGLKLAALRERIKISPYIVLGSGPTGA